MDHVAVLVAEDLNFDVPRGLEVLFQVHGAIGEGSCSFLARAFPLQLELGFAVDVPHAFAAATGDGFEHDRIADGSRVQLRLCECACAAAGDDGHTGSRMICGALTLWPMLAMT